MISLRDHLLKFKAQIYGIVTALLKKMQAFYKHNKITTNVNDWVYDSN